jgi:hypothetical protein
MQLHIVCSPRAALTRAGFWRHNGLHRRKVLSLPNARMMCGLQDIGGMTASQAFLAFRAQMAPSAQCVPCEAVAFRFCEYTPGNRRASNAYSRHALRGPPAPMQMDTMLRRAGPNFIAAPKIWVLGHYHRQRISFRRGSAGGRINPCNTCGPILAM